MEDLALRILERLGEHGISAMIRYDSERRPGDPHWTFAASGGPLEQGMRADGQTADQCLSLALDRLRAAGVDVSF